MLYKDTALFFLANGALMTLTMNLALSRIWRSNLIINPAGGDEGFINEVLKSPRVQIGALLINTVVPAVATGLAYYAASQNNSSPTPLEVVLTPLAFGASTAASLRFTISYFAKERLNIECINFSKTRAICLTVLAASLFADAFCG